MLQEGEWDAVREVGEAAGGKGVADVPHLPDHRTMALVALRLLRRKRIWAYLIGFDLGILR